MRHLRAVLILSSLSCCMPYQGTQSEMKPAEIRSSSAKSGTTKVPDPEAGYTVLTPVPTTPSNPAVATRGDLVRYVQDLETCKQRVASVMGSDDSDSVAAIRRALKDRPLDGKLTVRFEPGDATIVRDNNVKNCLRSRGYLVSY